MVILPETAAHEHIELPIPSDTQRHGAEGGFHQNFAACFNIGVLMPASINGK
jgi:hypothetical protein